MSSKIIFLFCAQALLIQSALSQCTSRATVAASPGIGAPSYSYGLSAPIAYDNYAYEGYGWAGKGCEAYPSISTLDYTPTSGGSLSVTSSSATPPTGLTVASDNVYEGKLAAAGELPFVGTVAVDSVLPTAGAGAINHHCGDGINAMVSDTTAFAPGYIGTAYAPAAPAFTPSFSAPALGFKAEWSKPKSCGCGW